MNAMNMNTRGAVRSNAKPTQGFGAVTSPDSKQQQQVSRRSDREEEIKRRQQQEQQWQM